jgi:hypothetical protein
MLSHLLALKTLFCGGHLNAPSLFLNTTPFSSCYCHHMSSATLQFAMLANCSENYWSLAWIWSLRNVYNDQIKAKKLNKFLLK